MEGKSQVDFETEYVLWEVDLLVLKIKGFTRVTCVWIRPENSRR